MDEKLHQYEFHCLQIGHLCCSKSTVSSVRQSRNVHKTRIEFNSRFLSRTEGRWFAYKIFRPRSLNDHSQHNDLRNDDIHTFSTEDEGKPMWQNLRTHP